MSYNKEYYFLLDAGDSQTLHVENSQIDWELSGCGFKSQPEFPYTLYMNKPVSKSRTLCDVYMLSGTRHVVSERIKNAIQELNPIKTDFLPANIHIKSKIHENFFILNCYNAIHIVDTTNSKYTSSARGGILNIQKLAIKPDKLYRLALSDRLALAIGESNTYVLFHESVIDSIGKVNPKGCHAVSVEAWNADVAFLL